MPDLSEAKVTKSSGRDKIIQFSIFADNKVGRLNDILGLLAERDLHALALATLDTTDSTIIRVIVDYPEIAREVLHAHNYNFNEVEVVAVEIPGVEHLYRVTCALVQAEINIHYIYPFLLRPHNKSALAIRIEDEDLAKDTLTRNQIKVLTHSDLAR